MLKMFKQNIFGKQINKDCEKESLVHKYNTSFHFALVFLKRTIKSIVCILVKVTVSEMAQNEN